MVATKMCMHGIFEINDLVDFHIIEEPFVAAYNSETPISAIDSGCILLLLHQFGNALTALQLLACGFIEIRCKLCESRQFAILSQAPVAHHHRAS